MHADEQDFSVVSQFENPPINQRNIHPKSISKPIMGNASTAAMETDKGKTDKENR
jgi:hypothetical protein